MERYYYVYNQCFKISLFLYAVGHCINQKQYIDAYADSVYGCVLWKIQDLHIK